VLTHGCNGLDVVFKQWHIDDEEMFILAIRAAKGRSLSFQFADFSSHKLDMPEHVSDAVVLELARSYDWVLADVMRSILRARDDAALEEKLLAANVMVYPVCGDAVKLKHAFALIKRLDPTGSDSGVRQWNDLSGRVPLEVRGAWDRKAVIWCSRYLARRDDPKTLHALGNLSSAIKYSHTWSPRAWSLKALQDACIEIGEFYGAKAATFLRAELKRRNCKLRNYTEETIRFLGANLPEDDARELAIETEPVCRKRDRRKFEEAVRG
jgi:hypothetical protein